MVEHSGRRPSRVVRMSDYKTDQDRFLDSLKDLADFRAAAIKEYIDRAAREFRRWRIFDTDEEARAEAIASLKRWKKIPADFIYPGKSSN